MDWKALAAAFGVVFLAELGDKTQLATLALSMGRSKIMVFLGAASALVLTTALAVVVGALLEKTPIPEVWIRRTAGVLFIGIGVWYLTGK